MLHKFLFTHRNEILALCEEKLRSVKDQRSSSVEMDRALPVFYDELIEVLKGDEEISGESDDEDIGSAHRISATRRGKESLRLGYTISQVVHGYGAICQSITEYSGEHSEKPISVREFNRLNFCLDVAIAEAVTEFSRGQRESAAQEEVQRLGFLAHEIRNSLGNVAMAHQMIKKGLVGVAGSTNAVLEQSIDKMKDIIDRSLSEVRLRGEPIVDAQRCRVIDIVGAVEVIAAFEAGNKSIHLHVEVPSELLVLADRHLLVSAVSNLIQNAIKFTKQGGHVWIRGTAKGDRVLIAVEDQCGGLPQGKIEGLFKPFIQKGQDKTGVGLGLSISKAAVEVNGGEISACDLPGQGCIFTIDLPRAAPLSDKGEEALAHVH